MVNDLRQKIERWMMKAEIFLKNNTKVFIVDIDDHYYWANLLSIGEEKLEFKSFSGQLKGERKTLWWADVVKFEEYKERGR